MSRVSSSLAVQQHSSLDSAEDEECYGDNECCRLSHLPPWVPAQAPRHEVLGRERSRVTSLSRRPGPAGACACQRWAAREGAGLQTSLPTVMVDVHVQLWGKCVHRNL